MRKTYPKEDNKSETIHKLRAENRQLIKQNKLLKEELSEIKRHIKKTINTSKNVNVKLDIKDVLQSINSHDKLKAKLEKSDAVVCPKCGAIMESMNIPGGVVHVCPKSACKHRYVIKG